MSELIVKLKAVSAQEIIIGFLSTLIFQNIWLSVLTAMLWAAGGTFWHGFRRILIPLAVYFLYGIHLWWSPVLIGLAIYILYQGDGFPDYRESTKDEGSPIGIFVGRFVPDMFFGGMITKLIPVILLQGVWIYVLFNM